MKIEILESAQKDLTDGASFYENIEQDLGTYFLDSLFSDIDSLIIYAGLHQTHSSGFLRLLAKRFPFAIYYQQETHLIKVVAVLDTRKKPAWTRKKLKVT
tara:strand:- start:3707 stop:4006 length:300 start_codon:yes stop_codon:yes gene_type:complete